MRLLLPMLTAILVLSAGQAGAATLTVTTAYAAADGACALEEAIDNANADAAVHGDCPAGSGADTLQLTQSLVLNANLVDANGPTGLPSVTSPMTLDGADHEIRRDSGAPAFRLLHVAAGGDLTVFRLTLSGGLVDSGFDNGGGIYNAGTLTLRESTLRDNRVASLFPSGGGLYNDGNLTVINSTLSGNQAADDTFSSGGGIYSAIGSTLYTVNARFEANVANQAGAVFAAGDSAVIENSRFVDNQARESGGALLLVNNLGTNTHRIFNSLFQGNQAARDGGAILTGSDDARLFGNRFLDNRISQEGAGGAIHNQGGILTIIASLFQGNRAEAEAVGGALANAQLGTVHLEGSILKDNVSEAEGGGAYTVLAPVFIRDSLITGNHAETGGGLFQAPSNVDGFHVQRSAIIGNSAGFGGGGVAAEGNLTTARLINTTVAGNQAPTFGGGIFLNQGGRVDISHTAVVDNISDEFNNSVGGFNAFAGTTEIAGSILAYNIELDCSATNASRSLGFNITTGPAVVGGLSGDRWCSFIPLQPTDQFDTDPLLAPLTDNGNLGPSRLPQAGSPAAAAIPAGCPPELEGVDQRGVPRPAGACDIGPVSRVAAELPVVAFTQAASSIVTEGTAVGPHTVILRVDNTQGTLAAPSPSLPLSLHLRIAGSAAPGTDYETPLPQPTTFTLDGGNWPAPGTVLDLPLDFTVLDDVLVEGDETIELAVSLTGPGRLGAPTDHTVTLVDDGGQVFCQGFYPPFHRPRVLPAKSRGVIPVKLELFDGQGQALTDADLAEPPRLRVDFDGETYGAQPREDHNLMPVGNSNVANRFAFDPVAQVWAYRLDTGQLPQAGDYQVSVYLSDDGVEYQVIDDGNCRQTFTRRAHNGGGRR